MNTSRKGLTLVEIMIVVVIICLFAPMLIPTIQKIKGDNNRARVETVKVEAPVIAGNPVEVGNPRFTYEKQNYLSIAGTGQKVVILVTDKSSGKQFLMVEDFGVADLSVVKAEAVNRYSR